MREDDATGTRPPAERPGLDANPLAPGLRDAPRREPRAAGSQLLEVVPFLLLAAVVVLVVAGR